MSEAVFIMQNVSPRSLIIMDELGRATSSSDGFAIAWSCCFVAHSSQLSYYSNYFLCSVYFCASLKFARFLFDFQIFPLKSLAYSILIAMSAFNHMFVILLFAPHVEQHSVPSRVHQLLLDSTPGGSELWTRNVAPEFKPYIGQLFGTLAEAISFYDVYAEACGFEPRKSSQKRADIGDVKYKYVVCNREGFRDRKRKAIVLDSGKEQQLPEGFYFAYEVDSGKCLVRAFWCDAESRRNYALFGDYITYDPTYDLISIIRSRGSFKSSLMLWGREPHCIITDQCAGIKLGLRAVFKHAKRRYCMWHIMQKLTDKVGPVISKETDFVSRLNAIVWDAELEPLEFEAQWCQLVNEHNLEGNSWLSTMFRKRRKWIPAYFRDVPMGCLLTTQRSESQNNFFKRFENAHGTLVEFLMRFQSAIDVQRHTQKQLDRDDDCTLPQLATSLKLEAHASKVYTNVAFADFQVEASASICSLSVGGFTPPANGVELIGIADARTQKIYQVVYNSLTNDAECSCKCSTEGYYL
ncbi:protein FAR1-RELATED SEQUENCE 5-like [Silene latifolia]|uniref:protein FAR1-RELATED SEQUENCE 5-like n=1 Tax=Silene latifolia TaxID=37657 RepID=UPI003D77FB7E